MYTVCVITSIIFGLFALMKEKKITNPLTILCLIYGITSLLAGLRLYNTIETDNLVFIIVTIGIISCFCGYLLATRIYFKNRGFDSINDKIVKLMIIFVAIFSTYQFSQVFSLLLSGADLDTIRMIYYGTTVDGIATNYFVKQLEVYLNLPFIYIIMIIFANYIVGKKIVNLNKMYITIIIYSIIVTQLCSGGRMIILFFIMDVIVAFLINKKSDIVFLLKKNKKVVFAIIFSIFIILYLTEIRTFDASNSKGLLYTIYIYLSCPYMIFSGHLESFTQNTTFGFSLISGFIRPFIILTQYITGFSPKSLNLVYDIATTVSINAIQIAPNQLSNAFTTMFSYFFLDGKWIGLIFDSVIMMFFITSIYKKEKKYHTNYYLLMYCLVLQALIFSFIRYQYIVVSMTLPFFYIQFLFKKNKGNKS